MRHPAVNIRRSWQTNGEMRRLSLLLGLAVLAVTAAAEAAYSRTGTPKVVFHATGPQELSITGTTSELDVAETDGKVAVTVKLGAVDTGIGLRNRHMREKYLETAKYPTTELVVAKSALKLPAADGQETSGQAEGSYTLHGVTKPRTFTYKVRRTGSQLHVTGAIHVNFSEHGVATPDFLGATVRPDVDVDVGFDVAE